MKRFYASVDQLHEMLEFIRKKVADLQLHAFQTKQLELAAEEVIVNIIRHAYKDRGGTIDIQVEQDVEKIRVTFFDSGPAFNPIQKPATHVSSSDSLDSKKIGGLGLLFIHRCVDELIYKREEERNCLTLIVKTS